MSLIMPDSGLLFWMVLIFAIVFVILAWVGFPMITGMLDKRRDRINNSLRLAKETEARAADMQAEHERMLEDARTERRKILDEAAEVKKTIIQQAKDQAKDEADKLLAEAKVRIEAETESALKEIRIQIATLSVEVAQKVIEKNLSDDRQQMDFVYKMLDEMENIDKAAN